MKETVLILLVLFIVVACESPVNSDAPGYQLPGIEKLWSDSSIIIIDEPEVAGDSLRLIFTLHNDTKLLIEAYSMPDSVEIVAPGSGMAAGKFWLLWTRSQSALKRVEFKFWFVQDSLSRSQIGGLIYHF